MNIDVVDLRVWPSAKDQAQQIGKVANARIRPMQRNLSDVQQKLQPAIAPKKDREEANGGND